MGEPKAKSFKPNPHNDVQTITIINEEIRPYEGDEDYPVYQLQTPNGPNGQYVTEIKLKTHRQVIEDSSYSGTFGAMIADFSELNGLGSHDESPCLPFMMPNVLNPTQFILVRCSIPFFVIYIFILTFPCSMSVFL